MHFDFQATGEFLAVSSEDGYVIHVRQEPYGHGKPVTVTTAVAANVNGDRVSVYLKEPSFLVVNGAPLEELDVERSLPHGGKLERHGGEVVITWPDRSRLAVTRDVECLNYVFIVGRVPHSKITGLLAGAPDGAADKISSRDGSTLNISDPDFTNKLYKQVGNGWRIEPSKSLFRYWPGESSGKFTDLTFPPDRVSAESVPAEEHSKAESVCHALGVRTQPVLDDCILDVGISGKPAFAAASFGAPLPPAARVAGSTMPVSHEAASTAPAPASTPDRYTINIGDTVSPDHPAAGAGTIRGAGIKQVYSFTGTTGQALYLGIGPCDGAPPTFDLYRPDDVLVVGRAGCQADIGNVTLTRTGTYRVMVTAPASARYAFSLRTPRAEQYSIAIGDSVSPDHPAKGAGTITEVGERQSYSFAGNAGDAVYVLLGPCEGAHPHFELLRPDGTQLDFAECHADISRQDLGRQVLPATGTYRIVVSTDKADVSSRYNFSVHAVPPDEHFAAQLPLNVSAGTPGRTAGRITAPGAQQFFDFAATPGTVVHVESTCSCPSLAIRAVSAGDTSRFGYFELTHLKNDWTLPAGGKYTIQVRSNGYTGAYNFTAVQAAPQRR